MDEDKQFLLGVAIVALIATLIVSGGAYALVKGDPNKQVALAPSQVAAVFYGLFSNIFDGRQYSCRGVDCDDGNSCTQDRCRLGECINRKLPDGTKCETGVCNSGKCSYICPVDNTPVMKLPRDYVGMAWNQGGIDEKEVATEAANLLAYAGVDFSRTGGPQTWWHAIEPVKGQRDWSGLDLKVNSFTNAEMKPLLLVWGTAKWASSNKEKSDYYTYQPADIEDWERWIATLVKRYGKTGTGQVKDWEIWNEPEITRFFHGTPEEYVRLLNTAYRKIKSLEPEARVWAPATFTVHPSRTSDPKYQFVKQTIEDGLFDVLAVHLYHDTMQKNYEAVQHLRRLLDQNGKSNVKIAVTETNFGTGAYGCSTISEEEQADSLRQIYHCMYNAGADHMFWWDVKDNKNSMCEGGLSTAGVLSDNLDPKDSFWALKEVSSRSQ